jgi:DNA-binding protein H-NS
MEINLDDMSLADLKSLQRNVEKAITDYEARKKKQVLQEVTELASKYGFSIAELFDSKQTKRKPIAPKYRHQENHDLTWSGRGRRPSWYENAELIV